MRFIFFILALLASSSSYADASAQALASESYNYVLKNDKALPAIVKSRRQEDFHKEIYIPTVKQLQKWPQMGNPEYDKYRVCAYFVDSYRNYADEYFRKGIKLAASNAYYKGYVKDKIACKALLGK